MTCCAVSSKLSCCLSGMLIYGATGEMPVMTDEEAGDYLPELKHIPITGKYHFEYVAHPMPPPCSLNRIHIELIS